MNDRIAYIVGKGGHAHVIRSLLPHARIRFLVDAAPVCDDIAQDAFFAGGADRSGDYYIGIGDNRARRSYFDRLKAMGLTLPRCVAPTAWVAADARLGDGVFLGPGAVVNAGSRIGDNVIVNTLASVDHDCDIGDDSQLTPGVTLGSHLRIGRGCFFGMKSCVLPRLEIGDGATVMAGALVVRSAPAGVMLGGAPARIMRGAADEAPIG
ncbi:MAG TPA: acetyltransferase [Allosphingosinicella sp.]